MAGVERERRARSSELARVGGLPDGAGSPWPCRMRAGFLFLLKFSSLIEAIMVFKQECIVRFIFLAEFLWLLCANGLVLSEGGSCGRSPGEVCGTLVLEKEMGSKTVPETKAAAHGVCLGMGMRERDFKDKRPACWSI